MRDICRRAVLDMTNPVEWGRCCCAVVGSAAVGSIAAAAACGHRRPEPRRCTQDGAHVSNGARVTVHVYRTVHMDRQEPLFAPPPPVATPTHAAARMPGVRGSGGRERCVGGGSQVVVKPAAEGAEGVLAGAGHTGRVRLESRRPRVRSWPAAGAAAPAGPARRLPRVLGVVPQRRDGLVGGQRGHVGVRANPLTGNGSSNVLDGESVEHGDRFPTFSGGGEGAASIAGVAAIAAIAAILRRRRRGARLSPAPPRDRTSRGPVVRGLVSGAATHGFDVPSIPAGSTTTITGSRRP